MSGYRVRSHGRFAWALSWPLRAYIRHFPIQRGKGLLLRRLLIPMLGRDGGFDVQIPPHGLVRLRNAETLGWSWLTHGPFEREERAVLADMAKRGGWVFDVGANVGLFSVSVAQVLTGGARLLAFEPLPANVTRLRGNLRRSGLDNVDVLQLAVAAEEGVAELVGTDDTAFSGLAASIDATRRGQLIRVRVGTIDRVWTERGEPDVSIMKLDIEGGEYDALRGATKLLDRCRPTLLIEAPTQDQLERIESLLRPAGYRTLQPDGFEPWNFLFVFGDGSHK